MNLQRCRHLVRGVLVVLAAIALCSPLGAQTPPRPAVDIRQLPSMWNTVWPTDFNRDGRTDLVAGERGSVTSAFGRVVVRLGNGNGTFGAAIASGVVGAPATTGDFNRDGRQDVVVIGPNGAMSILPGRGDGRFDSPRTLDSVEDFKFALSGDFDADGLRDLVIGYGKTVEMNPGLGDCTFGPQIVMFRESLAASSKHVFALVSAGKGMAVQSRSTTGGTSASTTPRAGAPPKWIRLERVGNAFTAHTSSDGSAWTLLGSVTVPMNQDIFVGVAVTSHAAGTLATAAFDDIFVGF